MNFNKRGLGKGLDALLATSNVAQAKKQQNDDNASQQAAMDGELRQLAVTALRSGQYQPRKAMAADALTELADSIRAQGVIQPIVVRRIDSQNYEIIAGERRWQAARQAGLQVVPCIIKNVNDRATVAIALIENIQREDLNAIEEARALERLQHEFTLTHQQVADAVGKSRAAVSNLLRLNQLSDAVKQLVEEKQLEMGHARALLALDDQQQLAAAQIIINKLLTVREAEKLVKTLLNPTETPAKLAPQPQTVALQLSLSERFGTKVAVNQNKNGKGKIVINFEQQDKLVQILALLGHEL
ncbi:ParB/RepB/Spo0J family partition protein [Photobacterium toruni]|uniref:Probable chromosome-partitioning protein ParB n=1 Tax=Photobacterium toruni TaxID=1935446 RepID=A0A1T4UNK4_9GAMM|nr:ParB/RepB/Spo0J family partition protein [Photobacterium toruni]MEC6816626.1 ParB/RepB/Spo0J family partition protein [Photobacterium toruni]SKA54180.1 putative chromosome-partitioning protein ParB [Photobacterium toruni]